MQGYIVKAAEIRRMPGTAKTHFLNADARRVNKSLGDLTGLTGLGFHIVEIPPGSASSEFHMHYYEDECVYVLEGAGAVEIGAEVFPVAAGDFIGLRAGGAAHCLKNTGDALLVCIVAGQRLAHDVADYPRRGKRLYRNAGMERDLATLDDLTHPTVGGK